MDLIISHVLHASLIYWRHISSGNKFRRPEINYRNDLRSRIGGRGPPNPGSCPPTICILNAFWALNCHRERRAYVGIINHRVADWLAESAFLQWLHLAAGRCRFHCISDVLCNHILCRGVFVVEAGEERINLLFARQ